ncbi:hypothetical protein AAFF_G00137050 [Aldrovandia affinis]|uniref:Uncharacterized protein n=1 Tax=Aldrovandia affinis TaxID=143900 RepID=A0AAD7TD56_9TELE|nr:hypothetical protein AAFF_G00137050 [Aldrovandia affinis]
MSELGASSGSPDTCGPRVPASKSATLTLAVCVSMETMETPRHHSNVWGVHETDGPCQICITKSIESGVCENNTRQTRGGCRTRGGMEIRAHSRSAAIYAKSTRVDD